MNVKPTKSGGRIVRFDTPYGVGHAEWDAAGNLVSESIEIREPRTAQQQPTKGPGDHLADVFFEKYNVRPCGACDDLKQQMNSGGVQWCRDNLKWIVEQVMDNAAEQRGWRGLAARLGLGREQVRQCVIEAVQRSEERAKDG